MEQRFKIFEKQDDWDRILLITEFAANDANSATTGMSSFFANKGFDPTMSFSHDHGMVGVNPHQHQEIAKSESIGHRMDNILAHCRHNMVQAQEAQAIQANCHRQDVIFEVDNLVWVNGKNLHSKYLNKKLDYCMYSPFKIIATYDNTYELQLPPDFDAHLMFNVELLQKDPNNPLPGQHNPKPPPIRINNYDECVVEHTLASRQYHCCLEYCIKWVGFEHDPG